MAVNISAIEFRHENFLEGVFAILDDTGLDPKSLELELTESVLMKKAEATESILKTLRAKGIQIAVDDFGTGYSSLSYLRKFPMDALKIDQSFVQQITVAPGETTIVTAIISMGRSLNLRVVAEAWRPTNSWNFSGHMNVTRRKATISAGQWLQSSSPSCSKPVYQKQSSAEGSRKRQSERALSAHAIAIILSRACNSFVHALKCNFITPCLS
jgi:predicted signal transduction protein with EAL and GGDEF domain